MERALKARSHEQAPGALRAARGLSLATMQVAEGSKEAGLVHYLGNKLHIITDEIRRWRDVLSVPYQEYKQMRKLEVRSGTYTAGG